MKISDHFFNSLEIVLKNLVQEKEKRTVSHIHG